MEGGGDFTPPSSRTPLEFTPRSSVSFDDFIGGGRGDLSSPASDEEFEVRKHEALRELQQLVNRYNDCFLRLKDVSATNEFLRKENLEIAAENLELAFVIEDLEKEKENRPPPATGSPSERKRDLLESRGDSGAGSDKSRGGGVPKSISIRSSGFLTVMNPPAGGTHRLRLPASPVLSVGEEEGEVEVDVYNQGTTKTELCNKWGETGWCPYGERCRFAHGVEELRPVIRHPRYKTQLCRMIGSGGDCPYGHRCHFRHALPADRRK